MKPFYLPHWPEDVCLLTEPGLSVSSGEESGKAGLDSSQEPISGCYPLFHLLYLRKLFLVSGSKGGRQKWVHPFLRPSMASRSERLQCKRLHWFSAIKILFFSGWWVLQRHNNTHHILRITRELVKMWNFSGPTKDLLTQDSSRVIKVI